MSRLYEFDSIRPIAPGGVWTFGDRSINYSADELVPNQDWIPDSPYYIRPQLIPEALSTLAQTENAKVYEALARSVLSALATTRPYEIPHPQLSDDGSDIMTNRRSRSLEVPQPTPPSFIALPFHTMKENLANIVTAYSMRMNDVIESSRNKAEFAAGELLARLRYFRGREETPRMVPLEELIANLPIQNPRWCDDGRQQQIPPYLSDIHTPPTPMQILLEMLILQQREGRTRWDLTPALGHDRRPELVLTTWSPDPLARAANNHRTQITHDENDEFEILGSVAESLGGAINYGFYVRNDPRQPDGVYYAVSLPLTDTAT